ncbi:hypothetical protein REPUB_Repub15cG0096500 [Reevesia pubescens]
MNRIVATKLGSNVYRLRIPWRPFSNDAAPKFSTSNAANPEKVWDYTGLGYAKYNARDADKEVLRCMVENKVLLSSLLSRVQDTDLQKKIYPSRLTSMSILPSSSSLEVDIKLSVTALFTCGRLTKLDLEDGNCLYGKLVVGAHGGKSQVRELAGLRTTGWNYSQNAVICTVEHAVENYCAWKRFLPAGPIALLPIGDNFSNIGWTMIPNESSEFKSMSEDDFLKAENYALDYGYDPHPTSSLLGNADIFSWLKGDSSSSHYTSSGWQGVNLGFGDASTLSNIVSAGIALGTNIGEVSLLKNYEADRKPANIMMMAVLDGFQKAYSVDFGPLNILRAAAFHGAHYISPFKKSIISYASRA